MIALPLYPQFGTEPNVYYIPPINVPEYFNKQLFGPGAELPDIVEWINKAVAGRRAKAEKTQNDI